MWGGTDVSTRTDSARADRGNSNFDVRHRYVLTYLYELPYPNRVRASARHKLQFVSPAFAARGRTSPVAHAAPTERASRLRIRTRLYAAAVKVNIVIGISDRRSSGGPADRVARRRRVVPGHRAR